MAVDNIARPGILQLEADDYPSKLNKRERGVYKAAAYNKNIDETFPCAMVWSASDEATGTPYTGAATEVIGGRTDRNNFEVYQAAVATPAVVYPYVSSSGLELQPVAAADALELTNGITSASRAAFTIGTDGPFFCEAKIKIDDISDVTQLWYGFRKAAAYAAAPSSYTDFACFNIGEDADGQIEIHTRLNNGTEAQTDTTETDWADAGEYTLRVEVDKAGLCTFWIDGAAPTVTTQFTFDSGDVVVPFLGLDTETGDPGVSISTWRVGLK